MLWPPAGMQAACIPPAMLQPEPMLFGTLPWASVPGIVFPSFSASVCLLFKTAAQPASVWTKHLLSPGIEIGKSTAPALPSTALLCARG